MKSDKVKSRRGKKTTKPDAVRLLRLRFPSLPENDHLLCDMHQVQGDLCPAILQKAGSLFFFPVWFRGAESLEVTFEGINDTATGDGVEPAFLALLREWNKKGKVIPPRPESEAISDMTFRGLTKEDHEDWLLVSSWREWNKQGLKLKGRATEHSEMHAPAAVVIGGDHPMVIGDKTYQRGETYSVKPLRGHPRSETAFKEYCREKLGLRFVK